VTVLDTLLRFDGTACRWVRSLPHNTTLDRGLAASSRATDHAAGWVELGLAGAVVDRSRRGRWLVATAAVVAADRAGVAVKQLVRRPRPVLAGLPPLATAPSPLSFPSTHTASAVAAAMTFGTLGGRSLLRVTAAVTAASRPYLGVHYPSDVIAGALLGGVVGNIGRRAMRRGHPRR
jgi:membrane-associated phospholipid phosphatase